MFAHVCPHVQAWAFERIDGKGAPQRAFRRREGRWVEGR